MHNRAAWCLGLLWGCCLVHMAVHSQMARGEERAAAKGDWLRTADEIVRVRLVGWRDETVLFAESLGAEATGNEGAGDEAALSGVKMRRVQVGAIQRYGALRPARQGGGVVLVDGTLMVGRVVEVAAETVIVRGDYFTVEIQAPLVRAVYWHLPDLDSLRSRLVTYALRGELDEDEVWTVRGDRLRGTLVTGEAERVWPAEETGGVRLRMDSVTRKIAQGELRGVVFSRLLAPPQWEGLGALPRIGLDDGSVLVAESVRPLDERTWRFTLGCGVDVIARAGEARAGEAGAGNTGAVDSGVPEVITAVLGPGYRVGGEPEDGRVGCERLGLLRPLRVVWEPAVGGVRPLAGAVGGDAQPLEDVREGELRLRAIAGRLYTNAIAMRVGSHALYRLPGGRAGKLRFELARIGEANGAPGNGAEALPAMRFVVQHYSAAGGMQPLWERTLPLPEFSGDLSGPVEIEVPAGDAILLEVLPAEATTTTGEGVWIDPVWWGR